MCRSKVPTEARRRHRRARIVRLALKGNALEDVERLAVQFDESVENVVNMVFTMGIVQVRRAAA